MKRFYTCVPVFFSSTESVELYEMTFSATSEAEAKTILMDHLLESYNINLDRLSIQADEL